MERELTDILDYAEQTDFETIYRIYSNIINNAELASQQIDNNDQIKKHWYKKVLQYQIKEKRFRDKLQELYYKLHEEGIQPNNQMQEQLKDQALRQIKQEAMNISPQRKMHWSDNQSQIPPPNNQANQQLVKQMNAEYQKKQYDMPYNERNSNQMKAILQPQYQGFVSQGAVPLGQTLQQQQQQQYQYMQQQQQLAQQQQQLLHQPAFTLTQQPRSQLIQFQQQLPPIQIDNAYNRSSFNNSGTLQSPQELPYTQGFQQPRQNQMDSGILRQAAQPYIQQGFDPALISQLLESTLNIITGGQQRNPSLIKQSSSQVSLGQPNQQLLRPIAIGPNQNQFSFDQPLYETRQSYQGGFTELNPTAPNTMLTANNLNQTFNPGEPNPNKQPAEDNDMKQELQVLSNQHEDLIKSYQEQIKKLNQQKISLDQILNQPTINSNSQSQYRPLQQSKTHKPRGNQEGSPDQYQNDSPQISEDQRDLRHSLATQQNITPYTNKQSSYHENPFQSEIRQGSFSSDYNAQDRYIDRGSNQESSPREETQARRDHSHHQRQQRPKNTHQAGQRPWDTQGRSHQQSKFNPPRKDFKESPNKQISHQQSSYDEPQFTDSNRESINDRENEAFPKFLRRNIQEIFDNTPVGLANNHKDYERVPTPPDQEQKSMQLFIVENQASFPKPLMDPLMRELADDNEISLARFDEVMMNNCEFERLTNKDLISKYFDMDHDGISQDDVYLMVEKYYQSLIAANHVNLNQPIFKQIEVTKKLKQIAYKLLESNTYKNVIMGNRAASLYEGLDEAMSQLGLPTMQEFIAEQQAQALKSQRRFHQLYKQINDESQMEISRILNPNENSSNQISLNDRSLVLINKIEKQSYNALKRRLEANMPTHDQTTTPSSQREQDQQSSGPSRIDIGEEDFSENNGEAKNKNLPRFLQPKDQSQMSSMQVQLNKDQQFARNHPASQIIRNSLKRLSMIQKAQVVNNHGNSIPEMIDVKEDAEISSNTEEEIKPAMRAKVPRIRGFSKIQAADQIDLGLPSPIQKQNITYGGYEESTMLNLQKNVSALNPPKKQKRPPKHPGGPSKKQIYQTGVPNFYKSKELDDNKLEKLNEVAEKIYHDTVKPKIITEIQGHKSLNDPKKYYTTKEDQYKKYNFNEDSSFLEQKFQNK